MLMLLSHRWVLSAPQSSPAKAEKQLSLARRLITTGRWDKPVEQLKCQQKVTQPENHGTSGLPRTTWNNCHDGFLKEQPLGAAQELYLTCLWGGENGNQRETGISCCPEECDSWHMITQTVEKYFWEKHFLGIGHHDKWSQVLHPQDSMPEHYIFFYLSPLKWSWLTQGRCWYHEGAAIHKATAATGAIKGCNNLPGPPSENSCDLTEQRICLETTFPWLAVRAPAPPCPQQRCHPKPRG